jgi:hypothetical protein
MSPKAIQSQVEADGVQYLRGVIVEAPQVNLAQTSVPVTGSRPSPRVKLLTRRDGTDDDSGLHFTIIRFAVASAYRPAKLMIWAQAKGVCRADIRNVDHWMVRFDYSLKNDRCKVTIEDPVGRYDLVLFTPRYGAISFRYAFEGERAPETFFSRAFNWLWLKLFYSNGRE